MASQLIKVTNAYSGVWTYVVQEKIQCFYENKLPHSDKYKMEVFTWLVLTNDEGAIPCNEPVSYFLAKFPPL